MKIVAFVLVVGATVLGATMCGAASADEIVLPAGALERTGTVEAVYRLDSPATGEGVLAIKWTDSYGRLVEDRTLPFALAHAREVTFPLDMRRAVAMRNELRVHLSFQGSGGNGKADRRENTAETTFIASPPEGAWSDYQIVMWQRRMPQQLTALKDIGVTAGVAYAILDQGRVAWPHIEALLLADLPWYVENIATDFYSAYHRWFPDRPKNWRFLEVQKRHRENPHDASVFVRDPSLSDPAWLKKIRDRLVATVRAYAPYRPLYYNLADEPGIAQTAAFWDFDLSTYSLKGMRAWLKGQYGSLAALNAQWGSDFADWTQVVPMTTNEAMARSDDNFSAWADFKAWMDVAFARALKAGTQAVHAGDPRALSAIEGGQIPGWGGYDYSRLADVADVMELYDNGENVEVVRSLNPKAIILTTSGGRGPMEAHRVWRELLRGNRGLILWDEGDEFVHEDGGMGERGRDAAPDFRRIRGGLGALFINAERRTDPIAMLYSQPSLRTQWMLDTKPKGDVWSGRDAGWAYHEDNAILGSTGRFTSMIEHMGLQHRFVSEEQVAQDGLRSLGYRVLILPRTLAMSPAVADAIRRFVAEGGVVIADGEPGTFDGHSRRLTKPLLSDVFGHEPNGTAAAFGKGRAVSLAPGDPGAAVRLARIFKDAGIAPVLPVTRMDGAPPEDVETYVFRDGNATIVALQRNPTPPAAAAGDAGRDSGPGSDEALVLTLPRASFAYDVLRRKALGQTGRIELSLGPIEPVILVLSDAPLPAPVVEAPQRLKAGETAMVRFGLAGPTSAAFHVLHVDVVDPAGRTLGHYSGNILFAGETVLRPLPLALNDKAGTWTVRVVDVLSGQAARAELDVSER